LRTDRNLWKKLALWFDSESTSVAVADPRAFDWVRCLPFLAMHLACLGVIWVGWSPFAVAFALFLYVIRMFAITGFYHRYFSHRSFKSGRILQLAMALLGSASVQRGPLWWAAHHRHHHRHSDLESDIHSPFQHGFLWSHMVWFTSTVSFATDYDKIKDFARFPELRFLNRYDLVVPVLFAVGIYALGMVLAVQVPALATNGPQLLIWGFFISTVALYHGTFTINSLAHVYGSRRFETGDHSRNNPLLALITLGEGWHNNHHRYPAAARQGFYWWEIDLTYYGLRAMAALGLIWDLREEPAKIKREGARGRMIDGVEP
jgi:stearoyl-CoA desaturase (delta-9 desaturase)